MNVSGEGARHRRAPRADGEGFEGGVRCAGQVSQVPLQVGVISEVGVRRAGQVSQLPLQVGVFSEVGVRRAGHVFPDPLLTTDRRGFRQTKGVVILAR